MNVVSARGKVACVTGGYGHLGMAMANALAQDGASVFVLARDSDKFSQSFSDSVWKERIFFAACDVAKTASVQAAYSAVLDQAGRIDVLVNNAMFLEGQDPFTISDAEWSLGLEGCLGTTFRCLREILPHMRSRRSGRIVNISSMYGMVSPDFSLYDKSPSSLNPPHYGAAKAAVLQLTRYYAQLLGKEGITVNAITPGPFPSPGVQDADPAFIERLAARTALGRIGAPVDLAGALVFLSSDSSSFMTGQNLVIDGGWTIH